MRITPLSTVPLLLGMAVLSACTMPDDEEPEASAAASAESSSPAGPTGEVYVLDRTAFEGDAGEDISLQRPEELTLSEFSRATGLEWQAWGGDAAVAEGRIEGVFCASACEGEAYEVTVVLCEVVDDHYRRFGIFGDFPEFNDQDWAFGGPLYIGGMPAGDEDWSTGCTEPEPGDLTGSV